jgi:hypothetical protein
MCEIRWENAQPWHLHKVAQRLGEPTDLSTIEKAGGEAMVMLDDDEPIAIIGLVPMYGKVAEAWTIISEHALRNHLISLIRKIRGEIEKRMSDGLYRRIQAVCLVTDEHADWMEALGFQIEGVLRSAAPLGEDLYICGRVQ